MKFIPILFSTAMVQALLQGRKTQTRRVMRPQPSDNIQWSGFGFSCFTPERHIEGRGKFSDGTGIKFFKCPYGQPGDILWVREKCCYVHLDHAHDLLVGFRERRQMIYGTDMHDDWMIYAKEKYGYKWKPSIHMPKTACRLFLKVKSVRVERLQNISEDDAKSEGVKTYQNEKGTIIDVGLWKSYTKGSDYERSAKDSFKSLWQSINGEQSWDDNPWVWVIEFEKIELTAEEQSAFLGS